VFLTELQQGDRSQKAAIKLIPADARDAEAQISCWTMTTNLSHPHLMRLFYAGRCQVDSAPQLYAVTEYSEEILSQILQDRPLTPTETREMLGLVLDALSYLHGEGFVHGNLKPSNILVVDDKLKLSSDNLHVAGKLGKHSSALGVYDAPETATGNISPAADIWSLGVTLVETLTGHPPVWDRSTHREPIVPESIPQPFADIVRKCLRLDPAHRCTLSDLNALLELAPALPNPASKTIGRTVSVKLRMTALIAAVLVLLAVIAVLQLRSRQTEPSSPTEKQQPVPAGSTLPPQAPSPGIQSSKGAAVKSVVSEQVLPDVLPSARQSIRGHVNVKIRVTVDASGHVSNATFDSSGPSKYFAKVALQAAQQWRFKPAQVDGQSVSSIWILQFQFTEAATEINPIEAAP
jgi:TonB family protein